MPHLRHAALLTMLSVVLSFAGPGHAEPVSDTDRQALDHIELLERLLRDAGVEPPARPESLYEADNRPAPIVPPSFATVVFESEVAAINERSVKSAAAIKHIRRWLDRDDVKRRVAAQEVIDDLTAWAELEVKLIESTSDPVDAYLRANDAIQLLDQDPLALPFKRFVMSLQRDRAAWREIESQAAYRRALEQAQSIGLLGDWALIDFQNTTVRTDIKAVTARLTLITNSWPNSVAAKAAQDTLTEWSKREAQAIANLPAWRYTWQMSLIQIGNEQETTIITYPDGSVYISEEQTAAYDPNRVRLYGTFQNTSDQPYRYTFLVGVTTNAWPNTAFPKLGKNQLLGYDLIQTPTLGPGELYKWETTVSVSSLQSLKRGGVGMVEVHERQE